MKKAIIILGIISVLFLIKPNDYFVIPNEAIRFRVVPNSNDPTDILMKEAVIKNLEEEITDLGKTSNIDDSREVISSSMESIDNKINQIFEERNYNMDYNVKYGLNYFPEKIYKDVKYERGYYESLVIEIGEAKGDNFWCVMFPPLCMIEEKEDVEYKSFIKEIFDKLTK